MFSDNSTEQRLSRTSQMSSKVEEDPQKGPWRQGKSQPLANFLQPRKMMCGFCDVRAVQCSLSLVACFCARLESEVKWQGSQITSHKRLHSHSHTHTHTHTRTLISVLLPAGELAWCDNRARGVGEARKPRHSRSKTPPREMAAYAPLCDYAPLRVL